MITTSKQRTARPAATCRAVPYISRPPSFASPSRRSDSFVPCLAISLSSDFSGIPSFFFRATPYSPKLLPPSPFFYHSSSISAVRKGRRLFERASLLRDRLAFSLIAAFDASRRRYATCADDGRDSLSSPHLPVEVIAFIFVPSFVALHSRGNAPPSRSREGFASISSSLHSSEHGVTYLRLSSSRACYLRSSAPRDEESEVGGAQGSLELEKRKSRRGIPGGSRGARRVILARAANIVPLSPIKQTVKYTFRT